MKATLEFDLPEQREEHDTAIRGCDYKGLIEDFINELRSIIKYDASGDFGGVDLSPIFKDGGAEILRESFFRECQERDLPIT